MSLSENSHCPPVDIVKGNFLTGSTFQILKDPVVFLSTLAKDYGPVVITRFGGTKYYVLQHPDYARHVWSDNYKQYSKPGATKLLRMFLGEGLSTSNGEVWLRQRKLMQPAFHSQQMKHFTDIINEEVEAFIQKLGAIPDGTKINATQHLLHLTIRIISRSMFSVHLNEEMDVMENALNNMASFAASWMKSPVKIPTSWPTTANRIFKKNCNVFDTIIYSIIRRRKSEIRGRTTPVNNDLLDMLLNFDEGKAKSRLNEKLIRDEATTIFMAGHETTAQTLSWTLYHLAKAKEINKKVRTEIGTVIGDRPPTFESTRKLNYIKQVIHETLRLYPPIWAVVRSPIKGDFINGLHLPPQSKVLLNIYGLHHHPDYWDHPEEFYPEHFDATKEKARPDFVFVPFGGGPRLCLGHNFAMLVMHIVTCRIAQSFDFSVPQDYVPIVEPNITLRAKQGIQLLIKKKWQPG